MEEALWRTVVDAFDRLEPLDPSKRRSALAQLDETTATHVAAMLEGVTRGGILDGSPVDADAEEACASMSTGDRVGQFVLERLLGRGGMGEVYLARRSEASFEQRVALKLLRVDAVPNAAAFDRERRMLARLDHPGIARLIDGGLTAEGRPWMAMSFVDGLPIASWCRANEASLGERLRLTREICDAVAYAHANLIVHRDLKPANILVDARRAPILLDFGIAKLLEDGVDTLPADVAMTPDYAAPEQLENLPLTVATDIHALGLILYELLTGETPWRGGSTSLAVLVRRVLHERPSAPSKAAQSIARPPVSPTQLRGDLDAIVLKALRKDPDERYATARELADDLARYESGRPVLARAGSRRYRFRKYLWRNRWVVAAVGMIIAALSLGAAGIAIQARRTAVERDNAVAEARRSDSIVQTLTLMFSQGGVSSDLTLKQTLDESSLRLLATLDGSGRSGAAVVAVSELYMNMGDGAGAYDFLSTALERGIGKDDAGASAQIKANLANVAVLLGKNDDAAHLLNEADAIFGSAPERYAGDLLNIVGTRAAIARRQRNYPAAIALLQNSLPDADRVWVANDSALLTHYNNLIVYLLEAGRMADVGPTYARLEPMLRRPGTRDTIQALGLDALRGGWQLREGDAAAAEATMLRVVDRRRKLFGDSAGLATDLSLLGRIRLARGRAAEARVALLEARPLAQRYLGETALPATLIDLSIAQAQAEAGDLAAARAELAAAAPRVRALPPANPLAPQLDITESIIALKSGDKAAAQVASRRARAALTAMGSAGEFGLTTLARLEPRIAAMP